MSTSGGSGAPGGPAGGDLAGSYPNPSVAQINTSPLGTTTGASTHQALAWSGTAWVPGSALTTGTASGDLTGTYPGPTVGQINGSPLGTTTGAGTGNVLTWSGSAWAPAAPAGGGGLAIYGDANDGAHTFDGSTTILGVAPSTNTYTMNRDWVLGATTINNGVSIITAGYRLFIQGTLTNNGTIQWNGNNATGTNQSTAGTALPNGNVIGAGGAVTVGTAGGNGATGAGSAGTNNASQGCVGAAGGVGGAGNSGAGAAAGTVITPAANLGTARFSLTFAANFMSPFALNNERATTGGSGGGGGGGDSVNAGGGGGGGGGVVFLAAKTITGTGSITANGGNGGSPTTSGTGAGGGGGGGGGAVFVISGSVSSGAVSGQTITANGGIGGTHHGTSGVDGTNGSAGTVCLLPN